MEMQKVNNFAFLDQIVTLIVLSLCTLYEKIGFPNRYSRSHPLGRDRVNRLRCVFDPRPPVSFDFFDALVSLPDFILDYADQYCIQSTNDGS